MDRFIMRCALVATLVAALTHAAPEVSFSGYLDADVWSDASYPLHSPDL